MTEASLNRCLIPENFNNKASYLIILTIFISVLALALPLLTLQVYDRIIPNPGSGTLSVLIMGVCVAVALEVILRMIRSYILISSGASYEHRMSCEAIRHVLDSDLGMLGRTQSGENINRLAAFSKLKEFRNGYDIATCTELVFVAIYIGLIAYIAGPVALVTVFVLAMFGTISFWHGHKLRKALSNRDSSDDKRYDFLIESLNAIHTLKAFCLEKPFLRRYEALQYRGTVANYHVTQEMAAMFNTASIWGQIMLASTITMGAYLVIDGKITSGAMIASILLSGRIMQPVQKSLALWTRYQDYRISIGKARALMTMPTLEKKAITRPERKGNLSLSGVSYRVADHEPYLFQNVDLSLRIGQCVQIAGAYGCGKSSLIKIMCGLYAPAEGSVRIDGADPAAIRSDGLLSHIGFLPTEGEIFRGTIMDNLTRFGMAPESDVRSVSALFGLEQDIIRLPRGYDTWLEGTLQDTVSPGLCQRISIVRVLATRPRIILFDNADRNLDRAGYRQLHAMLGRLKSKIALVMITEDRNLSCLADRHMILNQAGLTEIFPEDESERIVREVRA